MNDSLISFPKKKIIPNYRQRYSAYKLLLIHPSQEIESLLENINDHPNIHCIHLPVIYGILLAHQPVHKPTTHIEIRNRKTETLRDVLSYLDSLSFGVIR